MGVAAISYDSQAALHDFASRKNITLPLLSDHDSAVIRAFGVADRRYRRNSRLDVDSSGEVPVYGLAYPSVFVLGPDGVVRWRFVSEHEELRLTAANILARSIHQPVDQSRIQVDAGKVELEMTASDKTVGLGTRIVLGIEMRIPPGLHVYGPDVEREFHGTAWNMAPGDCLLAGDVGYPAPREIKPEFANARLPVYEGTIRLTREAIVKPGINVNEPGVWEQFRKSCLDEDGKFGSAGTLDFQACSDRECFAPQSVPVKWKFDFTAPDRVRVPVEHWRVFEQP